MQTAALAGTLSLPWLRRAAAAEPIKVGSLLDLTGPLGSSGQPMNYAIQLAIADINAKGGLLGRPLQLISRDPQSNIQMYSQFAQQMALQDKVAVVHAGITSASREAIRPVFDRYKTLYFYNTLYEGGVCDRDCFCTGTTPAQTVEKLVPYATKTFGKKAYIIAADYNYGQITAKWMKKYTVDGGGSIVGVEFFPLDVTNFAATITKIQEARPDVVMSALVGGNHVAFYRQWAAAGMKSRIPIISTTFGLFNELATLSKEETEGIVTAYGYYQELTTPASKSFVKAMRDRFPGNYYIGELAAATYEGVFLWAAGVEKAGSVDRMKTIEGLETGVTFAGPSGETKIDHATHHVIRNAYLAKAVNGKWDVIGTYPNQAPADTAAVCNLIKYPKTDKMFVIDVKT
ncbi:urea ABC transporter substrate-binding protein [Acidisphaera rubrifaciens]|uniref:ABC transporter branched chain amino-acid permease n=1 Tax=Acidisphaera rubrifaciens HS-AP3 TaxID=1231350 RepID=A0A0D6P5A6_9PROT|nr:ABC transporter substrate-binding protein [Acidisphaera rubrifaciens]GAN76069.1 ABC transporter branched chain amino-acid permease [Acidisphaera rubrifaciens HS-AP3]